MCWFDYRKKAARTRSWCAVSFRRQGAFYSRNAVHIRLTASKHIQTLASSATARQSDRATYLTAIDQFSQDG